MEEKIKISGDGGSFEIIGNREGLIGLVIVCLPHDLDGRNGVVARNGDPANASQVAMLMTEQHRARKKHAG